MLAGILASIYEEFNQPPGEIIAEGHSLGTMVA